MPYSIIKTSSGYELRLKSNDKLLGTHKTKKDAESQIKAIQLSKGRLNPDIYIKAYELATKEFGEENSARKNQWIAKKYLSLGGKYAKEKTEGQKDLSKWTSEDWMTKSGLASGITGERYLPKKVIEKLTPMEYEKTTKAKIEGTLQGKQYVKQPKEIVEKIKKIKKNL